MTRAPDAERRPAGGARAASVGVCDDMASVPPGSDTTAEPALRDDIAANGIRVPIYVLEGASRLLVATDWERAAFVAAFVEISNHPGPKGDRSDLSDLTPHKVAAFVEPMAQGARTDLRISEKVSLTCAQMAAIVAAFVDLPGRGTHKRQETRTSFLNPREFAAQGSRTELLNSERLTPTQFAALGLAGLKSETDGSSRIDHDAWRAVASYEQSERAQLRHFVDGLR